MTFSFRMGQIVHSYSDSKSHRSTAGRPTLRGPAKTLGHEVSQVSRSKIRSILRITYSDTKSGRSPEQSPGRPRTELSRTQCPAGRATSHWDDSHKLLGHKVTQVERPVAPSTQIPYSDTKCHRSGNRSPGRLRT